MRVTGEVSRSLTVGGQRPGHGPVPLRPLTVADLLDAPFSILRAQAATLALLAAIAVVPAQLLAAFLRRDLFDGVGLGEFLQDPFVAAAVTEAEQGAALVASFVVLLNTLLLWPVVMGMVARVGVSSTLGERLEALTVVRVTVRRWPALVAGWLLLALAAFLLPGAGALLMVTGQVAPVVLGVLLILAALPVWLTIAAVSAVFPSVVVSEAAGPVAAMRRTVRLLRSRLPLSAGVLLLALVVITMVRFALSAIPQAIGTIGAVRGLWVVVAVGEIIAGLVVLPYVALLGACLYLDARARHEALDVVVLVEELVAEPGSAQALS